MSRAFATEQGAKGWIIPVAVQTIPAIILLIGVPFCIESPRWLIAHGMKDQAIENMNKVRPGREREGGQTILEVEGFEMAIEESKKQSQGTSKDLFGRTYINRTIVSTIYISSLTVQLSTNQPVPRSSPSCSSSSRRPASNSQIHTAPPSSGAWDFPPTNSLPIPFSFRLQASSDAS
jgi:hypothetical protein